MGVVAVIHNFDDFQAAQAVVVQGFGQVVAQVEGVRIDVFVASRVGGGQADFAGFVAAGDQAEGVVGDDELALFDDDDGFGDGAVVQAFDALTDEPGGIHADFVGGAALQFGPEVAEGLGTAENGVAAGGGGFASLGGTRGRGLTVFNVFGLQAAHVTFVTLVGNHRKDVDIFVKDSLASLVDGQAQAAPDFLALFHLGDGLVEGANLENVGVVPAFFEGGVGKDEAGFFVKRKQTLFVAHDEFKGGFFGVAFGLVAAFGIDGFAVIAFGGFLFGKIGRADFGGGHCGVEGVLALEPLEFFVEHAADDTLGGGVVGDTVNEKEREHFDALALEALLHLHVLLNGLADLGAENFGAVFAKAVAEGEPNAVLELDEVLAGVDFADHVAGFVLVVVGLGIQVVAVFQGQFGFFEPPGV